MKASSKATSAGLIFSPSFQGRAPVLIDMNQSQTFGTISSADKQAALAPIAVERRPSSFSGKYVDAKPPRVLKGRPLGTTILVLKIEQKQEGMVVTPEATRRSDQATVLAVGSAVDEVTEGDDVLLRSHSGVGTEIKFGGKEYLLIDETDVLMILEPV
jgi:chaperonin GroES